MLYRRILKEIAEFYSNTDMALLVTGARQTGKTHTVREFGKTFKHFVEINFIENPQAKRIIQESSGVDDLMFALTAIASEPLVKGETLVFFDEVQECKEVVTAIKFLVDEGSYRYILSGSLLGVELNDLASEPVGYMGVMHMYPLSLEEFYLNVGVSSQVIERLRRQWEEAEPVSDAINDKMLDVFRLYLVVGGMPAVVAAYLEDNNLQRVVTIQQSIVDLYRRDISKYATEGQLRIKGIFDLVPSELNAKNKRFILKNLNQHAKFDRYKDEFLWLKDAGVTIPVYNVEELKLPLKLAECRNLFKLFSSDVGLLCAQYAGGLQRRILSGDKDINFGSVYENVVAQELLANELVPYYYNSKKRGEVDFVVTLQGRVLPIEVKSGKDYNVHRALANIMECDEFQLQEAVVLGQCNLRREGRIKYAPVYMAMFIKPKHETLGSYHLNLDVLQ